MSDVTFNAENHTYHRGLQWLASVSSVLRLIPDGDLPPADVLENARDRGVAVDTLFCDWIEGRLTEIPADTRKDADELFWKLAGWWATDAAPPCTSKFQWRTQEILADDEIAGTADLLASNIIADLKCTYDIMPKHGLQLGAYCHLHEAQFGRLPDACGIIHVTARFKEPKWVPFEVSTVVSEFRIVRDFWRLVQRKAAKRGK